MARTRRAASRTACVGTGPAGTACLAVPRCSPPSSSLGCSRVPTCLRINSAQSTAPAARQGRDDRAEPRGPGSAADCRPSASGARRASVEPLLASLAAASATTGEVARLRRQMRDEENALSDYNVRFAIALSGRFHMSIAENCLHPILAAFLRELVSRSSLISPCTAGARTRLRIDAHRALVDAMAGRNVNHAAIDNLPPRRSRLGARAAAAVTRTAAAIRGACWERGDVKMRYETGGGFSVLVVGKP